MRTVTEAILHWADIKPFGNAVVFNGQELSYKDLAERILDSSGAFVAAGIKPGEVVLLFLPQSIDAIVLFFGCMHMGAIPSFMPLPSSKQDHARYWSAHDKLLALESPAAIVAPFENVGEMMKSGFQQYCRKIVPSEELSSGGHGIPSFVSSSSDVALLQHSSGTTALKKGVCLTHDSILAQVRSYSKCLNSSDLDVVVTWLPMYHDMGLIACTVSPLMLGQTIILLDPFEWSSKPSLLFEAITRYKGTLVWLPNFAFELLTKTVKPLVDSYNLSSVKAFINCSEPCKFFSFQRFLDRFSCLGVTEASLQVCYAMAETVFAVTQTEIGKSANKLTVDSNSLILLGKAVVVPSNEKNSIVLLSAGYPLEGIDVRVCDDQGKVLEEGMVGVVELEGDFLFSGYFNRPDITSMKFRGTKYITGDRGFIYDQQLYVLGRNDDLIIVHGRNYFAHEVEAVANDIPGLKPGRNIAVDVFNDLIGSLEIVLIAETVSDLKTDEMLVLSRLVKSKVQEAMGLDLRDVIFVPQGWLIKSTSGKVSRSANKDKYISEFKKKALA